MTSQTDLPLADLPVDPERALPAGTRLDDCEIEGVVAQSSFSVVYRAYDHALRLHVAIKEYLPDALALRSDGTQVVLRARSHLQAFELGCQAFIGEARALARCEHPSLLRVDRILQRHGTVYQVMRYSPGPTLVEYRQALAEAPDETTLRAWLDGLLGALSTLHDQGRVHGAVAPGNILLLPDERPLLLGFDAVRNALISDRTQGLMSVLEPSFAPIEQRCPSPELALGSWTDLYALAATLHFCVGGRLPPPVAAGAVVAGRFEPMSVLWPRLHADTAGPHAAPAWLQALDACLAEVPQDRPESVARLRELMDEAQGNFGWPSHARTQPQPWQEVQIEPAETPAPASASELLREPEPPPDTLREPQPRAAIEPAGSIEPGAAVRQVQSDVAAANALVIADLEQTIASIAAQANEIASAAPAPAGPAPISPPRAGVTDPLPPLSGTIPVQSPRRPGWKGAVLMAALVLAAAGTWWLAARGTGAEPDHEPKIDAALPPPQAMAVPAGPELPTGTVLSDRAEVPVGESAVAQAPGGNPTVTTAAASAALPAAARLPEKSPRALCGQLGGYALYQCMQAQCAKRSLAKHSQCVRLKQHQSLG